LNRQRLGFLAGKRRNAMTRIAREDVIRTFGDIDDALIAEIIGTGATVEEMTEAQAWIDNDEALMNAGRPLPNGRVGELVEILAELKAADNEEDDAMTSEKI
jgi:hypothetical protein